jgi:hypothetical protein
MSSVVGSLKKIINDTTTEVINSELHKKLGGVVTTLVTSVVDVVDDTLVWIQEITKTETSGE